MNTNNIEETSKEYETALKSIFEKDITLLNNNLSKIICDIKKLYNIYTGTTISINGIEEAVEKVNEIANIINVKKNSIKVSIFSSNKKAKKEEQITMENHIEALNKYKTELYSMKDEYNKLNERKSGIKDDYKPENKPEKTNPLERTINYFKEMEKRN